MALSTQIRVYFTKISNKNRDIIVIGLQGVDYEDKQSFKLWNMIIASNLSKVHTTTGYEKIVSKSMLGLGIFLYAKKEMMESITSVNINQIKLQEMSTGAIVLR